MQGEAVGLCCSAEAERAGVVIDCTAYYPLSASVDEGNIVGLPEYSRAVMGVFHGISGGSRWANSPCPCRISFRIHIYF